MLERYARERLLARHRADVALSMAFAERERAVEDSAHAWLHLRAASMHEQCAVAHERLARMLTRRIDDLIVHGGSRSDCRARVR